MPPASSKYSLRRVLNGRDRPHHGTDYPAPLGSPVYTNKQLTVASAENRPGSGFGNIVVAYDAQGTEYRFAHLDDFAPGIKKGAVLPPGSQVGYVGSTGTEKDGSKTSTGDHLHYEIRRNGISADPETTIDPTTGKPYSNNASFEKNNGTSLITSNGKKDPNYTPKNSSMAATSPPGTNGRDTPTKEAPKTRSLVTPKTGEPPVSTRPDSIKIPRINPLLRLGD
jgi:murein DD-endopeptidase MepM/ murein hydrolase activator NlpD